MTIMPQWGVFVRLIVSDASMGQGCRTIRGTAGGRTPSNDDDGSDEHNRDADRHPVWVNLNLSAARLPVLGLRVVWPVHGLRPSRRPGHGTTLDPLHLDETSRRVGIGSSEPTMTCGTWSALPFIAVAVPRAGAAHAEIVRGLRIPSASGRRSAVSASPQRPVTSVIRRQGTSQIRN